MPAVRRQLAVSVVVRTLYGLISLLTPRVLAGAADPLEFEHSRYTNALFGGRDLTVAGMTLAALRSGRERDAVVVNLSCEVTDLAAAALEIRRRGGIDRVTSIGLVFSTLGWLSWLDTARRARA